MKHPDEPDTADPDTEEVSPPPMAYPSATLLALQLEEAKLENKRLREALARADAVLGAVWSYTDLDPEHTISCHADSLPEAYRRACAVLDRAREAGTPDDDWMSATERRHLASCMHGDCWCKPGSDGT